ncbi:hypothetical protein [Bacillus pseudomycoides]|uniref:hypothetical protein n=1 Tax=Bacillus pseudomycoides TaxID=64104 RepID=UPI000BF0BE69|nr:hypothetical protein [Bacillus pseudomycoides]PEO48128.1 hypothetical protein CN559_12630 [Bacillus pseudomycoides]
MKKYKVVFLMVNDKKIYVETENMSEELVLIELTEKRAERFAAFGKKLVNLDNVISVEVHEHVESSEQIYYAEPEPISKNEIW